MAKTFDPRKVLKQISNLLLREFFARRGELLDVPWDTLTEHKVEPVFEAWQALPQKQFRDVQSILRDINELADHRGIAAVTELLRYEKPELCDLFTAQEGNADKIAARKLQVRGLEGGAASRLNTIQSHIPILG